MRICPNQQCSFRQKFGRPADFREGFTTCSDCGATLVDAPAPLPIATPVKAADSDATRRLAVTAAVFLTAAGLPFIADLLFPLAFDRNHESIFQVGVTPFVLSFMLVEVAALVFPPWRLRRHAGAAARRPLITAAMVVGLLLAVARSNSAALAFGLDDGLFDPNQPSPRGLMVMVLLASLFWLALAWVVDQYGLASGFGAVIGGGLAASLLRDMLGGRSDDQPSRAVLMLIANLAVVAACVALFRSRLRGQGGKPSYLPFPISGEVASSSVGLLSFVTTVGAVVPAFASLERAMAESSAIYNAVMAIVNIDLVLLLGLLFSRPALVAAAWKRFFPDIDTAEVRASARKLLPRAMLFAAGLAVSMPVLHQLVNSQLQGWSYGGLSVIYLAAWGLDVLSERRAREQLGALVAVWPLHRLADVEPALAMLTTNGIEAHAQSTCYRALFHFFGPYAPINLLVKPTDADQALVLLSR